MSKYNIISVLCVIALVFFVFSYNTANYLMIPITDSNQKYIASFSTMPTDESMHQISSDYDLHKLFVYQRTENNYTSLFQQHTGDVLIVNATNNQYFTSIQHAIDSAEDGSLIYVTQGYYPEVLTIHKPVTILGENQNNTFISPRSSPNSYAITITQSNVVLKGFTISNKADGLYTTAVKIVSPYTTISDCTIIDTPVGIAVWSSYNLISHCFFTGCDDEGIVLLGSMHSPVCCNVITNCVFYQNRDGIELQSTSQNIVSNCVFLYNTHAGIDVIGKNNTNNQINYCIFENNSAYGIILTQSADTVVFDCVFRNNAIVLFECLNTTITNSYVDSFIVLNQSCFSLHNTTLAKDTMQQFYLSFESAV